MKKIKQSKPITLFISYAHEDEALFQKLVVHLTILERDKLIVLWHKGLISPGADLTSTIDAQWEHASTILLLVSPDFLASDDLYTSALQKYQNNNKVRIVPILLRPSDWKNTPLVKLQVLPFNKIPVTLWYNTDSAFINIIEGLHDVIANLRDQEDGPALSSSSPQPPYKNAIHTTQSLPVEHSVASTQFVLSAKKRLTRRIILRSLVFFVLALSLIFGFRFAYPTVTNYMSSINPTHRSGTITSQLHSAFVPTATKSSATIFPTATPFPTTAPAPTSPYTYSFPNGNLQGWTSYGPQTTITGTTDVSADSDGGALHVDTYPFFDVNRNTTGVSIVLNNVDLLGKTATCQVYIDSLSLLKSNSNDAVYFRLLATSPATPNDQEPTEYGDKYGPNNLQASKWTTLSLAIRKPVANSDDDPDFQPHQVNALEVLLKVDFSQPPQLNNNDFIFYIDNCKIA